MESNRVPLVKRSSDVTGPLAAPAGVPDTYAPAVERPAEGKHLPWSEQSYGAPLSLGPSPSSQTHHETLHSSIVRWGGGHASQPIKDDPRVLSIHLS